MPLLSLNNVSLAYGHYPLLQHVDFQIDKGERVCVVGRNGAGKSTLFKVIDGTAQVDDGTLWRQDGLRISYLEQDVPRDGPLTIYDVVAAGLGELGQVLGEYHQATQTLNDGRGLAHLAHLQHRIEAMDGWNAGQRIDAVLGRLSLSADKRLCDCSGGVRRRAMLARALVSEPDLLLLDEPTNHMDIAAIQWLEEFLLGFKGALLFITHDRTFLRHLATRIVELDRGVLSTFPGDYDTYLQRKEAMLASEAKANARFDRELAEHEAWVRQGIKARRTRNEGRVRTLLAMRRERSQRITAPGKVSLSLDSGNTSGKLVADLRHVSLRFGEQWIVRDFSTRIMRGDRIGIIGPNGAGKSTLIRLILGELAPDSGQVLLGTRLETAYFDQHRRLLDLDKSIRDNICEGSDYVHVRGQPRHMISYLRDFLFPPERINTPVRALSGGERNRLLLARIFTQPANMLVLDEPTNDLDVDTLELLEELLVEYDGTLLLVSHDRAFLDNVVTSTIVFEGDGRVGEYVGGHEDYLRQRKLPAATDAPAPVSARTATPGPGAAPATPARAKTKLSYNEKRELESLPGRIEALEQEQRQLESNIAQPAFYQQDKHAITATLARLDAIGRELGHAYERWEQLEDR